ncbi:MAG TPA: FKBP-type peptidyl-prolyl cis-trans isomerase [Flavisolibacter sp.]|jgi:FKBP-type peptidyl-prolyl cis-trans isomerase FklB|nr:FKBP-type peptidyl-prolyl cis-trans isomerase [Flavisolibacter sp.]
MKKYFVGAACLISVASFAQKTTPKKPVSKPAVSASLLKNANDSVSYAIGLSVANFYSQQGVKSLNSSMVTKAINDVFSKKKPILNEEQANTCVMRYLNPKLTQNVEAGERFLAKNKTKAGVMTTSSGLQYEVLKMGDGPKPAATDTVEVNYAGTLIDGTEFDNSYKRGQSISFPLNGVIRGWTEGVQLMPVGSKFKFYIPQELGYGMNETGPIPGGSVLVFEVELVSIKK